MRMRTHPTAVPRIKFCCTPVAIEICLEEFRGRRAKSNRTGFRMVIGELSSAIGVKELRRICRKYNRRVADINRSNQSFLFGNKTFESLGKRTLPLAAPYGVHALDVNLDLVAADVLALVGHDFLDTHPLMVDTVTNRLEKRTIVPDGESGAQYLMDE